MISREEITDHFTKQESCTSDSTAQNLNINGVGASSSSATSWSRLKDPRIVRVSRAFGGKDRHSKVCTVRGLRDRRVRLSVPTAIQLYDLQDRLGLNQPSKVVDWLLNAAKHEIDELPPLQFPQGSFSASLLPMLNNNSHQMRPPDDDQPDKLQGALSGKSNHEVSEETRERDESWARSSEEGRQFNLGINQDNAYVSTESCFSASRQQNPSSLVSSLMNSSSIPINPFVRWDPSNLSLSQSHPPRSPGSSPHHPEDWHNFSLVPMQSAAGSHHHQVLAYQPSGIMSTHPYFHSQISAASNAEFDSKHFQSSPTVESSSLPARSVHFNMTANLLPSQNNDGS